MAIGVYTVSCAKCDREIGPAHAFQGEYLCTSCILGTGTVWSNPKSVEPDPPRPVRPPKKPAIKKKQRAPAKRDNRNARSERQRMSGAGSIYAIQMKPGIVKVGRTSNWAVRKHSYTNGFDDVIKRSALFRIIDDFVVLPDIETALLQSLRHPRAKGYEWLFADFDEIAAHTDAFLRANCIMFEREDVAA